MDAEASDEAEGNQGDLLSTLSKIDMAESQPNMCHIFSVAAIIDDKLEALENPSEEEDIGADDSEEEGGAGTDLMPYIVSIDDVISALDSAKLFIE